MTTTSVDELVARAISLQASSPTEAEALYIRILELEPGNLTAVNALEKMGSARRYSSWIGVNSVIDPRDDIFKFFEGHYLSANPAREYLYDGWRTLAELMVLLETVDRPLLRMNAVLEFAAGFGRFTRHLSQTLPGKVTVADVLPGSVDFLCSQFGVTGIHSSHNPDELRLEPRFDMVFVLSLFTHLPPRMWQPWLKALARGVKPGGVLVITTHSESTARKEGVTFGADGTHFVTSSESPSLDGEVYGTTFTTRRYTEEALAALPQFKVLHYRENAFWTGQDGIVIEVLQTP